jgi:hypothetical protein
LRKATSLLLDVIVGSDRTASPDWWTYFGSFGDDAFDDENADDGVVSRACHRRPATITHLPVNQRPARRAGRCRRR